MNLDKRLLRWAMHFRSALYLTVGLGFAAGVFTVVQAGSLSRVIDQAFLGGHSLGDLTGLLAILLGAIVCRALLVWGGEVSANALSRRVKTALRRQLIRCILAMGPVSVRGERTGELTNVAMEGAEALDAYISQYLPGLALAGIVPLTCLVFVFSVDVLSGFVLLLTAPLIPIFMALIGSLSQTLTHRQWQSLSRMSAYFLDVLQGLTTLKALGHSRQQVDKIAEISDRFRRLTMSVLRVTFLSALVLEMAATLSTAVVAVEVGLRLLYGRLPFQQAMFVLLLAPEFYLPLRLLGARFHAGMSGVAAARRIFEILEGENSEESRPVNPESAVDEMEGVEALVGSFSPQLEENRVQRDALDQAGSIGPEIAFRNVHFTYPNGRTALRGVSFDIPAGQTVALVGPSGGGKSTVAALLLRFAEPSQGEIFVDGRTLAGGISHPQAGGEQTFSPEVRRSQLAGSPQPPLGEQIHSPAAWRARVAWVPQNPYLFNGSVLANIRLARPEACQEQVVRAAQEAGAHEFIQALPQGYHTLVGERGARLSGGEAQRIVLARAFLKDSPLIVMDEATANLDPDNETRIQATIHRLLQGRTALIIAHRLNTVRQADRILVLDRGEVVETGAHHELVQRSGLYRALVEAFEAGTEILEDSPQDIAPLSEGRSEAPFEMVNYSRQPPARQRRGSMEYLAALLGNLAPFKGWVALSVLAGFATVMSGVGLMTTSAYLISAAALHPFIAELQLAIVGVRFFGIARGVFRYLERILSHNTTFRILGRLRVWFYQALEPLAPARLMSYRSGDLLTRILADIESLESFYVRAVAPPLTAVLTTGAISVFLASFHTRLALIWLFFMALAGFAVPLAVRALSRRPGEMLVDQRASLNAAVVDCIQGLPDLFTCNQEKRQAELIENLSQELAGAQRRMAAIHGFQTAALGSLANLGMVAVIIMAIPLISSGQMGGVFLAVVTLAALTGFEGVAPLPQAMQLLENNLQAARRLFEVVDACPEIQDPPDPLPVPERLDLEVRELGFRYPVQGLDAMNTELDWVLREVSFSLHPGERLAIVGPSGAGKTTLVNLLLRFWEYQEGRILLGSQDIRRYSQEDVRSCIGVVSQNTFLFSASVRENLLAAHPTANEAEIVQAAEHACIHDFIQSLPRGYDTWIGEQGYHLSGGERQRLAIARSLLKIAPSCNRTALLILDEAAANLDSITARRLSRSIYDLRGGLMTLVITHRLTDMETMDQILVLNRGRVEECGRHDDLLSSHGLYRRMWDLQH